MIYCAFMTPKQSNFLSYTLLTKTLLFHLLQKHIKMGGLMSQAMDESFQKNKTFMKETQDQMVRHLC